MEMRFFLFGALLLLIEVYAEGEEKNEVKGNELAHGFGDDIDWVKWTDAKQQAKTLKKPIFLLIHKSWCGACQALKTTFQMSTMRDELVKLSKEFVMVNTEDDEEPQDERYSPDGQYIPRIFFLDEDGAPFNDINNKASYPRNSHYFPQLPNLIKAMHKAIEAFKSPTRGKSEKMTDDDSTEKQKVDSKDDKESDEEKDEFTGCPHAAKARAMKKEREAKEKSKTMQEMKDTRDVDEKTADVRETSAEGDTDEKEDGEEEEEEMEEEKDEESAKEEDDREGKTEENRKTEL